MQEIASVSGLTPLRKGCESENGSISLQDSSVVTRTYVAVRISGQPDGIGFEVSGAEQLEALADMFTARAREIRDAELESAHARAAGAEMRLANAARF